MFVVHGEKRSNKRVRTIIKTSRDPLVKHSTYNIRTEGYIIYTIIIYISYIPIYR